MPEPSPLETKPESGRVIRTMRSDVEQFLKTEKPSLTSILTKQVASDEPVREPRQWFNWRIAATGLVGVVLLGGAIFYFIFRQEQPPTSTLPVELPAPPNFVYFETTKSSTIAATKTALLDTIQAATHDIQPSGTVMRLVFREASPTLGNPVISLGRFFSILNIAAPSALVESVSGLPQFFIYYGKTGPRFGFMTDTKNPQQVQQGFISWESSIQNNITPLLLNTNATSTLSGFIDQTYRNIDFRYLAIATTTDLGIGYFQFEANHRIIMTTSLGESRLIIDRLFEK